MADFSGASVPHSLRGTRGCPQKSEGKLFNRDLKGPLSLHYENKQQQLLRLKDGEDNENVKRWIDEFVERLEEDIEHAKISEERE